MDIMQFFDMKLKEDVSAPDISNAKRALDKIVASSGMEPPSRPLEEVVEKVRKRHRIDSFLAVSCIVLVALILLMGFALFMRGYIANVTVNRSLIKVSQTADPPRSVSVGYSNGELYIQIAPGGVPLDYSSISVLRVSDGGSVQAEYDAAKDTVYIPCPRENNDYALTVYDTQNVPHTFTLHLSIN